MITTKQSSAVLYFFYVPPKRPNLSACENSLLNHDQEQDTHRIWHTGTIQWRSPLELLYKKEETYKNMYSRESKAVCASFLFLPLRGELDTSCLRHIDDKRVILLINTFCAFVEGTVKLRQHPRQHYGYRMEAKRTEESPAKSKCARMLDSSPFIGLKFQVYPSIPCGLNTSKCLVGRP